MDQNDLKRRALAAYYQYRGGSDFTPEPEVVEHNDKTYVVIYGNAEKREVYRLRNDGVLRRLRRWPQGL